MMRKLPQFPTLYTKQRLTLASALAATLSLADARLANAEDRAPLAATPAVTAASAPSFTGPNANLPKLTSIGALAHDASLKSRAGADFEVYAFAARDALGHEIAPAFRFFIEGGLHANEDQTTEFVHWLMHRFSRGESPLALLAQKEQIAIDFLPAANPDGRSEKSRYNARGVNLNRNFGVLWGLSKENPGTESFSEPETRAIRGLFVERHYSAAVDVHGYVNWIVAPSDAEAVAGRGMQPSKERVADYRRWRGAIREEIPLLTGYQLKTGAGLGDGGAFEDWAFWTQGTFAYCLEMETFQRFVRPYRQDFNELGSDKNTGAAPSVDLYKRYEAFIYRTFARAIALKKAPPVIDNLAGK